MQSTRYSRQILMELEYSRQILENQISKFRVNLSSGSRVVPCACTDMTKLIVACRNSETIKTNAKLPFFVTAMI
jgi:hypothetical protein